MVESLNFFFIGDCSISLFRSPLSALALMMGPMQSGLNFTDRIIKYVAKSAERKTKPASPSKGHVIPPKHISKLTHLIPPVTIVTVKKFFICKALKALLTDVLVHFLQIWKK